MSRVGAKGLLHLFTCKPIYLAYAYIATQAVFIYFAFPIFGLGNGGHCDTWYYWGMARSPLIAESAFEIKYYPASRVLNYSFGWLFPIETYPIISSRLIPLVLIILVLVYCSTIKNAKIAKVFYLGLLLLCPFVMAQFSTSYAQIPLFISLLLAIAVHKARSKNSNHLAIGFLLVSLFLSNANFIFAIAPFIIYVCFTIIVQKKFLSAVLGGTLGFLFPAIILLTKSETFSYALSYPLLQFNSIKPYLVQRNDDFDFFTILKQLIQSQTLFLLFLLFVVYRFFNKRSAERKNSNQSFLLLSQIGWQILNTLLGKGDFFTIGYASIATMAILAFLLLENTEESVKIPFSFSIATIFLVYICVYIIFANDWNYSTLEIYTLRFLFPWLIVIFIIVIPKSRSALLNGIKVPITLILIAFSSLTITDYSYIFMNNVYNPNGFFTKPPIPVLNSYEVANSAIAFSEDVFSGRHSLGFSSIEAQDETLNAYIRAGTRSSATCGMDWSVLSNDQIYLEGRTLNWPSSLLLIKDQRSGFNLDNLPGYRLIDAKSLKIDNYILDFLALESIK
jgi:hypothetical protein